MDTKWIDFQNHKDGRGNLVVAEYAKEIPFLVRRIYYIYGVEKDKRRGFHAHKNLKQIYIPIHGSLKVTVDDGCSRYDVLLNDPKKGLYFGSNVWREIYDFSEDAILMVLASEEYNESDYIRNYEDFLKWSEDKNKH